MSYDLFLDCYERGEPGWFPKEVAERAFGPYVVRREESLWQVKYTERDRSVIYFSEDENFPDSLTVFSVNHPCTDIRLYEGLYEVMGHGNIILYFPGDCPPLTRQPDICSHLPPDLVESLEKEWSLPIVISSPQDIIDGILSA